MDNDSFRLLKALSEKEKMTYRDIIPELELHPKTVRAMLDRLIKSGLVKEEGRENWRRGKRLWYSLTEKGRNMLVNEALERVNEGLKIVKEFSSMLLSEKSKLEEWRKASSQALMNVRITEDMPIEERIRRFHEKDKKTLLTDAYKNMHKLVCEGFSLCRKELGPQLDPSQFFIGFPDGYLYSVHVSLLKEKGLYEKFKG